MEQEGRMSLSTFVCFSVKHGRGEDQTELKNWGKEQLGDKKKKRESWCTQKHPLSLHFKHELAEDNRVLKKDMIFFNAAFRVNKRPSIALHLCCLSLNFFLSWTSLLQSPYDPWVFPGSLIYQTGHENREGWTNFQEVLSQLCSVFNFLCSGCLPLISTW